MDYMILHVYVVYMIHCFSLWGGWRSNSCLIAPGVYIEAIHINGIILTASSVEAAWRHATLNATSTLHKSTNTSQRHSKTLVDLKWSKDSKGVTIPNICHIFPPPGKRFWQFNIIEQYEVWVITGAPHFQEHRSNRMPLLHGHLTSTNESSETLAIIFDDFERAVVFGCPFLKRPYMKQIRQKGKQFPFQKFVWIREVK